MNKALTAEEAIARILKFDYILDGVNLLETVSIITQDAKNEYELAIESKLSPDKLKPYKLRLRICRARLEQAESLFELFEEELYQPKELVRISGGNEEPKFTLDSIDYWAAINLGIEVERETENEQNNDAEPPAPKKEYFWKDVEIRLYKDGIIKYKRLDDGWITSHMREFNFMGNTKTDFNQSGNILLGLSKEIKFPSDGLLNKNRTSISKIRYSLKRKIGIKADPFYKFDKSNGYRPKFKLIDKTSVADERAKEKAIHIPFNDEIDTEKRSFDNENDEAGQFIKTCKTLR